MFSQIIVALSILSVALGQSVGVFGPTVELGGCRNFALLAGSTMTFDGEQTEITSGDIGVSPGTAITGDRKLLLGREHSNDAEAIKCAADAKTAFDTASALTCTHTIPADLSNKILTPGVYCPIAGNFVINTGSLVLNALGNPLAEFFFKSPATFVTFASTSVELHAGARADNVYWVTGSSVTIGNDANMVGNLLTKVSITYNSGSVHSGRGLGSAGVTFASGSKVSRKNLVGVPVLNQVAPIAKKSLRN
jgi:hypothetical protein